MFKFLALAISYVHGIYVYHGDMQWIQFKATFSIYVKCFGAKCAVNPISEC